MSGSAEERLEALKASSTMSPEKERARREEREAAARAVEARLGPFDPAKVNRAKWTDPVGWRPVSQERQREIDARKQRESDAPEEREP